MAKQLWEYLTVERSIDESIRLEEFEEWELVSTVTLADYPKGQVVRFYFKRPKEKEKK